MRRRPIPITAAQPRRSWRWRRAALALLSLPVIAIAATSALAKTRPPGKDAPATRGHGRSKEAATRTLQKIADAIRQRLKIDRPVTVELVDSNPYLVSVEAPEQPDGAFVLRVEAQMLELLSDDEMQAVLAHELGHVWIFTHHPYLQTELLANQVAMRAVSRDALARVYGKVWKDGAKGDLVAFLGNAEP